MVRHKRDDEDRSPDYDKLMAAEQAFVQFSSAVSSDTHSLLLVLRLKGGGFILERNSRRLNRR